ncbi:hypothetical protein Tco_0833516 [Tanacetum coccineum]
MVACLEKSEGIADFHEIVDFLTASSVHYALTVSPTIYASCIEQFWNTAHFKTVNDVKQIHATVDGKIVVISESSVRSDLYFNDEDGITCLINDAILENLALMGEALQEDTQFPQTSVPILNIADEAVFKEWDDRVVRATTTAASLDTEQASGHKHTLCVCLDMAGKWGEKMYSDFNRLKFVRWPRVDLLGKRKLVQVTDPGGHTPGSDKERIEQDDLTDFVPPTPYDSPLSGCHTHGSDEGRPNINKLMAIYTNLSNRVLALEQSKTAQDLVIRKLKKKVRKLEKKLRTRTMGMKLFKIGTSKRKSLDEEFVSK